MHGLTRGPLRRLLSPLVATLLLILVSIGAVVLLYSWFHGASSRNPAGEAALYTAVKVAGVRVEDGTIYVDVINTGRAPVDLRGAHALLIGPGGVAAGVVDLQPPRGLETLEPGQAATLQGRLPEGIEAGSYRLQLSVGGVTAVYQPLTLSGTSGGGGGGGPREALAEVDISYTGSTDLNDYPVKLALDPRWQGWSLVSRDGGNIYFTDPSGNPLYYWIQKWDPANKQATIWVLVPLIKAGSTTKIYMHIVLSGSNPYADHNNPKRVFPFFVSPQTDDTSSWQGPYVKAYYNNDDIEAGFDKVNGKFQLTLRVPDCSTTSSSVYGYVKRPLSLNAGSYEMYAELFYSLKNYDGYWHSIRIFIGSNLVYDDNPYPNEGIIDKWYNTTVTFTLNRGASLFKIGTYWRLVWCARTYDGFATIFIRPKASPEPTVTIGQPSQP